MKDTGVYQAAYDAAEKEFQEALRERNTLDVRILRLKQTKSTLMRLMGTGVPTAVPNKGISDAVRDYLKWVKTNHHPPASIREIRDQLESVGYDFSNYKNANASISGTLERLVEMHEVKKTRQKRDDGITVKAYYWVGEAKTGEIAALPAAEEGPK
jgi:hypothetical protein